MTSPSEPDDPSNSMFLDPTAHDLYEALTRLGRKPKHAAEIIDRLKRLSIGLPAEDEFAAIVSWLGRCKLIQKLDQDLSSRAKQHGWQIPDFLAIFEYQGREIPVLIEVKTSRKPSISWRPDVFAGLQAYGRMLNLPVLLAWKYSGPGMWCLVGLDRFQRARTNFRMTLGTALQGNLLGYLAGDFVVVFRAGAGVHFEMRKVRTIHQEITEQGTTEQVVLHVEDVFFMNNRGERINRIGGGLWPLLLATDLEEQTTVTENGYHLSFVAQPEFFGCWAHSSLVAYLSLHEHEATEAAHRWRHLLKQQTFPVRFTQVREAATDGIKQGLVQFVLDQQPDIIPSWLEQSTLDVPAF